MSRQMGKSQRVLDYNARHLGDATAERPEHNAFFAEWHRLRDACLSASAERRLAEAEELANQLMAYQDEFYRKAY